MENKQHRFSGSTVNEDMMILTIKPSRGSRSTNGRPDVKVLDDCGSVMVLGCNSEQTRWIIGCSSIWDHHLLVL